MLKQNVTMFCITAAEYSGAQNTNPLILFTIKLLSHSWFNRVLCYLIWARITFVYCAVCKLKDKGANKLLPNLQIKHLSPNFVLSVYTRLPSVIRRQWFAGNIYIMVIIHQNTRSSILD